MLLTQFISEYYIYILIGLATFFILLIFVFLFYALSYKKSIIESENKNLKKDDKNLKESKKQKEIEKKEKVKKNN